MGELRTAVDLTEKGIRMHSDLMPYWRSLCHFCCSAAHLEVGDMEEARTHAEQALQFSLENNEKQWQGLSRIWLGRVVAKADATQIEEAEQHIYKG